MKELYIFINNNIFLTLDSYDRKNSLYSCVFNFESEMFSDKR